MYNMKLNNENKQPTSESRFWIAWVYVIFLATVIPWYWPEADTRYVLGFPLWALVSTGVSFLASVFTAWVYLSQPQDKLDP